MDTLDRDLEEAFRDGAFVPYGAVPGFVRELRAIAERTGGLTPARALELHETLLAGCHEKANEVDDSGGQLGELVVDLFEGWIGARQAAGADPGETAARLVAWMDDDPFGYCHQLERHAVTALDPEGLLAFERAIRGRVPTDERGRWRAALRTVLVARDDLDAYVSLCVETTTSSADALAISRMLASRRQPAEALAWAERGLALARDERPTSSAEYELTRLRRTFLVEVGRRAEAVADAWEQFERAPGPAAFEEVMSLGLEGEAGEWRARALGVASTAPLFWALDLLLHLGEVEVLAARLGAASDRELEELSHHSGEATAKSLEPAHPAVAARVLGAQAARILDGRKGRHYDAALRYLEGARRCYLAAGRPAEWDALLARLRAAHQRKKGVVEGLAEVAAGRGPSTRPTFLERARARWLKTRP